MRRRPVRLLLALALIAAPLTVTAAVLQAPPALAALHGPVPADESGDPQDEFVTTNGLFAYVRSDLKGGVICVVPGNATEAGCAHPAWGTANTVVGIGTQQVLLEAPPLVTGTWRLAVVDSIGQEGELSDPFTVSTCTPGPGCDPTFAQEEVQRYKAAAKALQSAGHYFCKTTDEVASVRSYVTDPVDSTKKALREKVESRILDAAGWTGYVNDIKGFADSTGLPAVKSILAGEGPGDEKAKEILKYVACATEDMATDIVADPPSTDYGTTVIPQRFSTIPVVTPPSADALLDSLDRQRADGTAGRQSFERYQGAVAATDLSGRHRQAVAISSLVRSQVDDLHDLVATLGSFATDARSRPALDQRMFDSQADKDKVEAFRQRVRDSGFTTPETDTINAAGFGGDIAQLRADIGDDTSEVPVGQSFADALDQVSSDVQDSLDGFDAFARAASRVAALTNGPPSTVGASVVPTSVYVGEPVAVDATSTEDPDGDPLTYHWDFGDGAIADSATASHTYADHGTYTVRLTLSDGFTSATASSPVTVLDPDDRPPVAAFAVSQLPSPSLEASFDASASRDPEGDALSFAWDFGDSATSTEAAPTHTYLQSGTYTVSLTVSDPGAARSTVTHQVTVRGPDAAPVAAPDPTLTLDHPQVIDLLVGATDSDGDPLTVRDVSDGVSCSSSGICRLDPGTPSFTYVVDDGRGRSAPGSVTITGQVPSPDQVLVARPDLVATQCCTPATVDVTANDEGDGLQVDDATPGAHGSVACTTEGLCTYTPSPGSSGFDTFHYTLSSTGAGSPTQGLVRLRVAPATVPWTASAAAGPSLAQLGQPVSDGGPAVTTSGVSADLPQQLAVLAAPPTVTGSGSGTTMEAPGFSHGTASGAALLGTSSAQPLPAPLQAVSQGTGGDGHVPILVGNRVFAFFHHSTPTQVSCVDRSTGQLCPGYPRTLLQGTGDHPGEGAVVGTQLWSHLLERDANVGFCWDSATDAPCGEVLLPGDTAAAPVLLAGRIWWATGQEVLCVDPATHELCAGVAPIHLADDTGGVEDAVGAGHRLYVSTAGSQSYCVDVSARALCAGWPPGTLGNDVMVHHSRTGLADGACFGDGPRSCVLDADPTTVLQLVQPVQDYYTASGEVDAGTRTFWADRANGLFCWDWTTSAPCAGPHFDETGAVTRDVEGQDLPASTYGAAFDGTCVVGLGDPGQVFSMTTDGVSPCASLSTQSSAAPVDLRRQRCDGTVGQAHWTTVTTPGLDTRLDVDASSIVLTVRDAVTGLAVLSADVDGQADHLDLSGIDPAAHPSLSADAAVSVVRGSTAWDDTEPQVVLSWSADPAQECSSTTVPHACPPATTFGLDVSVTGGATARASVPVLPGDCPVPPVVHLVPAPPVITAAVPRPTKLLVDLAPGDGRGSPILRWTVTAVPKDHSATRVVASATEPVLVAGLRNNVDYTLTAVATNAWGDSAASAPFKGRPGRLPTVTLKASSTRVVKGTKVTLTGKATVADQPAGRRAIVLTTLKGSRHVVVARTTTSSKGTFTFKVKVSRTTSFQARFVLGPSTTFNKALRVTVTGRAV